MVDAIAPYRFLVKVSLDPGAEQALGWKCCNLQAMNLTIMVKNLGPQPALIESAMELVGDSGRASLEYLYPHGLQRIDPGDGLCFYCCFDELALAGYRLIQLRDREGRVWLAPITGGLEPAHEAGEARAAPRSAAENKAWSG